MENDFENRWEDVEDKVAQCVGKISENDSCDEKTDLIKGLSWERESMS
jgi:hypothetical protein